MLYLLDLKYDNHFDYVIEQTCFCAIHPNKRIEYEKLVFRMLKTNGKLIGLWFPLDKDISEGGPPWATSVEEVKKIFSNGWIMESEKFSPLSIEPRKGREKLIVFRKV